jgi:hypothetical protein
MSEVRTNGDGRRRLVAAAVLSGWVVLLGWLMTSCNTGDTVATPSPSPESGPQSQTTRGILIEDSTGRSWDVTHALNQYGMKPEHFHFGLGVGAIPSVDDPKMVSEGDPDYPARESSMRVFGVDHNGSQRAYSIARLTRHEVFNELYADDSDEYVAVTY